MRGDSGEESACLFVLKQELGQKGGRTNRANSKFSERNRMPRQMQHRLQKLGGEFFPIAREWRHQIAIGARVAPELFARKIDIAMQTRRAAVIERMCERDFRLDPIETKSLKRHCFEKWRTGG